MRRVAICLESTLRMLRRRTQTLLGPELTARAYRFRRTVKFFFNHNYYRYLYYRFRYHEEFVTSYARRVSRMFDYAPGALAWFRDQAQGLLYDHPLDAESIVFDVGGCTGTWAAKIVSRYEPRLFIFEPIEDFCSELNSKFTSNPKVHVLNYGLGDSNSTQRISFAGVQSSLFSQNSHDSRNIQIRDVSGVFRDLNPSTVDLISINIEGGEYCLLKKMLEDRLVERCKRIQIQFHEWYPSRRHSHQLRNDIRGRLKATHRLVYDYPFFWECWVLRKAAL